MNHRLTKLRGLLEAQQLQGIVLTEEANVSWLFGGRYHINVVTESSCAIIYVTDHHVEALVNNIEASRVEMEEGLHVDDVYVHPWYDDRARQSRLESWLNQPGIALDTNLKAQMRDLRTVLEPDRLLHVHEFGVSLTEALEAACRASKPGESELSVAGRLANECLSRGIEPIVNLVGNERRSLAYRHLLPTADPIHEYAIVSVGGRQDGLVLSATRMFHFGAVTSQLRSKYESVLRVEAAVLEASQVHQTAGYAFCAAADQYEREGYAREWTFHHQGGIAGYQSRELRASADSNWVLRPNILLAWNPSIRGVKAEETALLTEDGPDILTRTADFPLTTVSLGSGFELQLPDILEL